MTLPIDYREFLSTKLTDIARYSKWDVLSIVREFVDAVEAKLVEAPTGLCHILSKGDDCDCTLCKQSRKLEEQQEKIKQLEATLDRIRIHDTETFADDSRRIVLGEPVNKNIRSTLIAGYYLYIHKIRQTKVGLVWHENGNQINLNSDFTWFGPFEIVEPPKPIELVVREAWKVQVLDLSNGYWNFVAHHDSGTEITGAACDSREAVVKAWNDLRIE